MELKMHLVSVRPKKKNIPVYGRLTIPIFSHDPTIFIEFTKKKKKKKKSDSRPPIGVLVPVSPGF